MIGLLIAGAVGYMLGEDDRNVCAHNRAVRLHNAQIEENDHIEERRITRENNIKYKGAGFSWTSQKNKNKR